MLLHSDGGRTPNEGLPRKKKPSRTSISEKYNADQQTSHTLRYVHRKTTGDAFRRTLQAVKKTRGWYITGDDILIERILSNGAEKSAGVYLQNQGYSRISIVHIWGENIISSSGGNCKNRTSAILLRDP